MNDMDREMRRVVQQAQARELRQLCGAHRWLGCKRGVVLGVGLTLLVLELWTDVLGLERLHAWIDAHWRAPEQTAPFEAVLLATLIVSALAYRRRCLRPR